MHNYTVCLISEEWGGPVAEMLLTRCARAYYYAGSFSIGQAGARMTSLTMSKLTPQEKESKYNGYITYVNTRTGAKANKARELQRHKFTESFDAKQTQVDAVQGELRDMKKVLTDLRAKVDDDFWKDEFPEEYAMYQEFKAYLDEAGN